MKQRYHKEKLIFYNFHERWTVQCTERGVHRQGRFMALFQGVVIHHEGGDGFGCGAGGVSLVGISDWSILLSKTSFIFLKVQSRKPS